MDSEQVFMAEMRLKDLISQSKELSKEYDKAMLQATGPKTMKELDFEFSQTQLSREDLEKITAALNIHKEDKNISSAKLESIQKITEGLYGKQLSEINSETLKNELENLKALAEDRLKQEHLQETKNWEEIKSDKLMEGVRQSEAELEKPVSSPMLENNFFKHWKIYLLVILFLLPMLMLRKKEIKVIEVENQKDIEDIKLQWKKIKNLKLSPREEVIRYYNLLQESLKRIRYAGTEDPPSCIIYEDFKEDQPQLGKAAFAVTEIFAQCFYGNRQVNQKNLATFRKSLKLILKVFKFA
jgi:hypothetical protein